MLLLLHFIYLFFSFSHSSPRDGHCLAVSSHRFFYSIKHECTVQWATQHDREYVYGAASVLVQIMSTRISVSARDTGDDDGRARYWKLSILLRVFCLTFRQRKHDWVIAWYTHTYTAHTRRARGWGMAQLLVNMTCAGVRIYSIFWLRNSKSNNYIGFLYCSRDGA